MVSHPQAATPPLLLYLGRPDYVAQLAAIAGPMGGELRRVEGTEQIVKLRQSHDVALIIVDVASDPGLAGLGLLATICHGRQARYIPIICLVRRSQARVDGAACYRAGCVDLLSTPLEPVVLRAKIRLYLDLHKRQHELEEATRIIQAQNQQLRERAIRDGLTGLYNHIHFQELFTRQFALAQRRGEGLCLLLFDLDYFKEVNDTFGHQVGDQVLAGFARLMAAEVRESDILARYGGEEFALALLDTDLAGARLVAEKIRKGAAEHDHRSGKKAIRVTVSVGVARFSAKMRHPADLIELADDALYQAKSQGRNRTVCLGDEGEELAAHGAQEGAGPEFIRQRLLATIERTRSHSLAALEAMVHLEIRDYHALRERNRLVLKVVNLMGQRLGLAADELHTLRRAFKLHDLFRLFIADPTLWKSGPLSGGEKAMIRSQPMQLKEFIALFDFFAAERALLGHHHENYDGSGYPQGLADDDIPRESQIFALVEAVVAMCLPTYERPFMAEEEIVTELGRMAGSQFDPGLVEVLLEVMAESALLEDLPAGDPGVD
ncbi:MAG: diguanylate cyclase [Thermodesulfobacteriota bacterium]